MPRRRPSRHAARPTADAQPGRAPCARNCCGSARSAISGASRQSSPTLPRNEENQPFTEELSASYVAGLRPATAIIDLPATLKAKRWSISVAETALARHRSARRRLARSAWLSPRRWSNPVSPCLIATSGARGAHHRRAHHARSHPARTRSCRAWTASRPAGRLKATRRSAQMPVIFMTGLTETEHVVHALEAGGVDYLSKPINIDELRARIRVHLAQRSLGPERPRRARRGRPPSAGGASGDGNVRWSTPQATGWSMPPPAATTAWNGGRASAAWMDDRGRGARGHLAGRAMAARTCCSSRSSERSALTSISSA